MTTSPDGTQIAYGYDDGSVEVAGADATTAPVRFQTNTPIITNLALSDNGARLAVNGLLQSAPGIRTNAPTTIFDVASGTPVLQMNLPYNELSASVMSLDGTKYAEGGVDPSILGRGTRAIDVDSGQVLLELDPSNIMSAYTPDHFNFDGSELAVATYQGLDAWRLSDGTLVKSFGPQSRALSPSWAYEVAETATYTVQVLRTYDGSEVQAFPNFYPGSTFAGFEELFTAPMMDLPDHDTGYLSQYIWDLQSGAQLRILPAPLYSGATGSFFALPGDGGQLLTVDRGAADIWCR